MIYHDVGNRPEVVCLFECGGSLQRSDLSRGGPRADISGPQQSQTQKYVPPSFLLSAVKNVKVYKHISIFTLLFYDYQNILKLF